MLKEVTQEEFRQEAGKGLVLADFYSTTCGPCKMLAFVLADVDKTCGDKVNIMKIDFDKCKELLEEYGVDADSLKGRPGGQAPFRSPAEAGDH